MNKELMEELNDWKTCADHIGACLVDVAEQRDAALARVAELEAEVAELEATIRQACGCL